MKILEYIKNLNLYRLINVNKKSSYWKKFIVYVWYSIIDYFSRGFGYHAAAISFFTLMSLLPFLVVLTVLASYLLNMNSDFIKEIIAKFFPSITQNFVDFLMTLSSKREFFGIVGFLISSFFASGIFTALLEAFSHIFEEEKVSITKTAFVRLFAIPISIFTLVIIYTSNMILSSVLEVIMSFTLWKYIENLFGTIHLQFLFEMITDIANIIQIFTFFIFVFVMFGFLTPVEKEKKRDILFSSFFTAFILFILKFAFNTYIIFASKTNPIYGSLSGIFAFLAWLYLSYGAILIGGRILYYLTKSHEINN